jgi:FlaA1/EpsC-like NDP-sugar epimerase
MNKERFIINIRWPVIIMLHLTIVVLSYVAAFGIRFDFEIAGRRGLLFDYLLLLVFVKMLVFYLSGMFGVSFRYVSMQDLWQIVKVNTGASAIFVITLVFFERLTGFPRSVVILDWGICLGVTSAVRFLARWFRERAGFASFLRSKKALLVGAGEAGILVLREFKRNPNLNTEIVGFIDDNPAKRNLKIHGVKVRGTKKDIVRLSDELGVQEIIIAIPSASGEAVRDIISYCQVPDVKIKTVPGMHRILNGDLQIKLREVTPEDLLGRESVSMDEQEIKRYVGGKTILVTGAAGSIGSELCRQLASFSPGRIVAVDFNENDLYFLEIELKREFGGLLFDPVIGDVRDVGLLKRVFSEYRPQVIFHSSAFKHVPLMEKNPSGAVRNNIIATRNLIYACNHYGAERFVFISTDKAVNPTSVMGATKRIAEMLLQAKSSNSRTKLMAVRFGNVIGSKGSVVPLFRQQIERGGPVTVTDRNARRYFMSVREAIQLVLQAAVMGEGGEVFILDMGEQIKIIDLANNLINFSGLSPGSDIKIEFTGLRPGEKISEEMFLSDEKDYTTKHDKIYISRANHFDPAALKNQVKSLEKLADRMDEKGVLGKIREIIPSYDPLSLRDG